MATKTTQKLCLVWSVNKYITRSVANVSPNIKEEIAAVKSFSDIPGPSSWPFIGAVFHFLPKGSLYQRKGDALHSHLEGTYGPIVKVEGFISSPTMLFLYDPEDFAHIYRSENLLPKRPGFDSFAYYRKVESQKCPHSEGKATYQGVTGLITDHGEEWKGFRQTVNPILLQPKTVKLYTEAIDEIAQEFVQRIKSLRNDEQQIKNSFGLEMNKWALESVGVVGLGGRLGCLKADLPEDSPARQLIHCVHEIHTIGQKLDFEPSIWRQVSTPAFRNAMKIYEKQIKLSRYFINLSIENKKQKENTNTTKGVLEKLLDIDENVALIMATDMLFAGVDTASNSMLAALYLLAKNPDKQEKLREEINSGDTKHAYLKACIKEALRMLPVVGGNIRETTKDYGIKGYHIPKGKIVIFCHEYLSNKDSQYPKAKQFIPERWLVDKSDPLYHGNAHPFAMAPFGFGTRQCIGQRIAQLEFECFIKNMVRNFRLEWNGPDVNIDANTLNFVLPPFYFAFKDV